MTKNLFYDLPNDIQNYIYHIQNCLIVLENYNIISTNYSELEIIRHWFMLFYKRKKYNTIAIHRWFELLDLYFDLKDSFNLYMNMTNGFNYYKTGWDSTLKRVTITKNNVLYSEDYTPYFYRHTFDFLKSLESHTLHKYVYFTDYVLKNYEDIVGNYTIDLDTFVKYIFEMCLKNST